MARRRKPSRRLLETRAPRKPTLVVAAILYVVGLFGYMGWFPIAQGLAVGTLAVAGALLLLGSLMRDL